MNTPWLGPPFGFIAATPSVTAAPLSASTSAPQPKLESTRSGETSGQAPSRESATESSTPPSAIRAAPPQSTGQR